MNQPSIKLVVIRSADIEATVAFYQSLGFTFTDEQHGNGPRHFAVEINGLVFEIYPTRKAEDVDRTTRLGFSLPDLYAAIHALRTQHAIVVEEPEPTAWGPRTVVRDPDGRA